jgi:uncharacterized membrane protein (DUF373 family)
MTDKKEEKSLVSEMKESWPELNIFEKFEHIVSLIIMLMITIIIVIALLRLGKNVFTILVINALDPLEFKVFQLIFGNMLTLFIAMEFRHSIQSVLHRRGHIIQVRTILLISMLAIARKFIVMDKATSPETMAALAFILISLGVVYWLLKHSRLVEQKKHK